MLFFLFVIVVVVNARSGKRSWVRATRRRSRPTSSKRKRIAYAAAAAAAAAAAVGVGAGARSNGAGARRQAFDLLDAISRSGALPLVHSALHVVSHAAAGARDRLTRGGQVLASTLCFDKSLMETVTHDNVNPVGGVAAVAARGSTLTARRGADRASRGRLRCAAPRDTGRTHGG